eukprot:CAMPEP_0170065406 /NCGR_PEP_ID=MMETSP0019_2-20121128/5506_1 /TAXON_ID=98059 /ORGANISM="Dinobryon sp., Strain UTEXLB2267" /LENGTH=560 /DNA_ID=CAMNT_0010272269 /DNA_START=242 /DNA_END=1921 /DNA_ORIENTATION=-
MTALPNNSTYFDDCKSIFLQHPDFNLFAKDDQGYSALHIASALGLHQEVSVLLEACPPESLDSWLAVAPRSSGVTALHRCVSALNPCPLVASALVRACSDKEALLALRTSSGLTALHLAALGTSAAGVASGRAVSLWRALLDPLPARARKALLDVTDGWTRQVPDLLLRARAILTDLDGDTVGLQLMEEVGTEEDSGRTGILSSPECSRHLTCSPADLLTASAPPENTRRLEVLLHPERGVLRSQELLPRLWMQPSTQPAALADVLRVHEWSYVRRVQARCEQLQGAGPLAFLDGDTAVCEHSFDAALHAAGAVCEAVDRVLDGSVRNAFCPVRPPGHHAGPRGVVRASEGGPDSHGFCLLNNISIAAAYAMNRHRDRVKKVAIVDFDVHHGNGTEETVRWLRPSLETAPVVSDLCFGQLSAPFYKPWLGRDDPDNVMFVSVHGYGPRERGLEHLMPLAAFYPGTGKTQLPVPDTVPTQKEGEEGPREEGVKGPEEDKEEKEEEEMEEEEEEEEEDDEDDEDFLQEGSNDDEEEEDDEDDEDFLQEGSNDDEEEEDDEDD